MKKVYQIFSAYRGVPMCYAPGQLQLISTYPFNTKKEAESYLKSWMDDNFHDTYAYVILAVYVQKR